MYQFRPINQWRVKPVVLKPLLPAVQRPPQQSGWKPIYKPPVHVPAPPQMPNKPWQDHHGWAPQKPVVVSQPPVYPVKPVVSVKPVVPVVPVRPVAPAPVVPVQPAAPFRPVWPGAPAPAITPLFPSTPYLYHVTRPNLPVLPLGAAFPSPILNLAHSQRPGLLHLPANVPSAPFPRPSIVEFHGNHNFFKGHLPQYPLTPVQQTVPLRPLPVAPAVPFTPAQQPVPSFNPVQQPLPFHQPSLPLPNAFGQFNPQIQLPRDNPNVAIEQHDVQNPVVPQSHQHIYDQQDFMQGYQQQMDDIRNYQQHQQNFEQNYQQVQSQQYLPPFQEQTGLSENSGAGEGFQQQQQLQEQSQSQVIRPGMTDVQLPLHLPSHPQFASGNFGSFQQNDFQNAFRPSVSLQPPFSKRVDNSSEDEDERKEETDDKLE